MERASFVVKQKTRIYAPMLKRTDRVTAAEAIMTFQTEAFHGREYFELVQRLNDKTPNIRRATFGELDARNPLRKKITIRDVGMLYGQRPNHPDTWYLSPYEFVMYWEVKLVDYPMSLNSCKDYHVDVTSAGNAKLQQCKDKQQYWPAIQPQSDIERRERQTPPTG